MKKLSYPVCVFLALIVNLLLFLVIATGDARVSFRFDCISGCEDWYAYATSHIFTTSGLFMGSLFGTPLIAVALAFRSVFLQKILLVLFLLILAYDSLHLVSVWDKSFDIHGDETGAANLLVSTGIGVLSVFVSLLSTAINILTGRGKAGKTAVERSPMETGILEN